MERAKPDGKVHPTTQAVAVNPTSENRPDPAFLHCRSW